MMTELRRSWGIAMLITCAMATMAWAAAPVFDYQFPASFDGTSNTCTDLSTAGNHATMDNDWMAGNTGYAADERPPGFATGGSLWGEDMGYGETDNINLLVNSSVVTHGGFTYDTWVKPTGTSLGTYIIDYAGTETLRLNYNSTEDEYKFHFRGRVGYWNIYSDPIELNTWYHVRVSFDAVGLPVVGTDQQSGVMVMVVEDPVAGTTDTKWNGMVKTGYGDTQNRPIGLNRHSNDSTAPYDIHSGYLFNPKVNLGPDPTIDASALLAASAVDPNKPGDTMAHWALNDLNSGLPTVVDSSANGLNGTAEGDAGAVVMEQTGAKPYSGTAAGFNPGAATTDGQVMVPYDAKLNTESFSAAFWMNAESANMDNWMGFIDTRGVGAGGFTIYTGDDATGNRLYACLGGGIGGTHWARCLGVVTGDTWTHIALTYDADTDVARLYMDGDLTSLAIVPDYVPNDSNNFYIGRLGVLDNYPFYGDMDDVWLFDFAMTDAEVAALMDSGTEPNRPGPATIPGDATGDGVVNELDAQTLATNWGASGVGIGWAEGDFDGDALVGPKDASIMAANWGYGAEEGSGGAVPEPSMLVLLLGMPLVLLLRRQR